jgi:short-subunit dehydrogenase
MLTGKVILITGASSGIGAALARRLARENPILVLAARGAERLEALAEELRSAPCTVLAHPCDVTDARQAERLVARAIEDYGHLDVLVNNAGRGHFASVEDTDDETIARIFAVNTFSLWYTSRPAVRHMKERGSGHIINVASIAGKIAFPYNSAYVAAKHACVGFTNALRLELLETGVHASVVCPAGVLTEWAENTEGGPMLPLFSQAGPIITRIARERAIALPAIEGVKSPEEVAEAILDCIHTPVAEVYTHRGSREFVVLSAREREQAERQQLPAVLGEREVYARLRREKA